MIIKGLQFTETCSACPEQYDVYKDNIQIAYIRLRWGTLRCEVPDYTTIYEYNFDDNFQGCFYCEESRQYHLEKIADLILYGIDRAAQGN